LIKKSDSERYAVIGLSDVTPTSTQNGTLFFVLRRDILRDGLRLGFVEGGIFVLVLRMGATETKDQGGDMLPCCSECYVSSIQVEKQEKSRDEIKYNQWSNSLRLTRKELMPLGNQVIPCTPHPDSCLDYEYSVRFKLNDQISGQSSNRRFMLDRRNGSRSPTPRSNPNDEHREPAFAANKQRVMLECRSPIRLLTDPEPLASPRSPLSPFSAAHCCAEEDEQLWRLHRAVIKVSRHCGVPPPGSEAARSHLAACARGEDEEDEDEDEDEDESDYYGTRSAAAFLSEVAAPSAARTWLPCHAMARS
jgi:hypothetical protein